MRLRRLSAHSTTLWYRRSIESDLNHHSCYTWLKTDETVREDHCQWKWKCNELILYALRTPSNRRTDSSSLACSIIASAFIYKSFSLITHLLQHVIPSCFHIRFNIMTHIVIVLNPKLNVNLSPETSDTEVKIMMESSAPSQANTKNILSFNMTT